MKTHDVTGRSLRQSAIVAGRTARPALALLIVGALGGCGSSSSGDGFAEFEGTWRVDFGSATVQSPSTFQLTCPTTGVSGALTLWDRLVLEPGTLSDLVETSGPSNCQFAFDVDAAGRVATVAASDPYTMLATECRVLIQSGADAAGNNHDLFLDMKPTVWAFSLLMPVKGTAPPGNLAGTAVGTLVDVNVTANTTANIDTCTYVVSAVLAKLSK
jgi:hypothetical protein